MIYKRVFGCTHENHEHYGIDGHDLELKNSVSGYSCVQKQLLTVTCTQDMVDELLSLTQPSAKRNTTANLIWLTF